MVGGFLIKGWSYGARSKGSGARIGESGIIE